MVRTVVELDADVAIAYDSYGLVNKLPLDRGWQREKTLPSHADFARTTRSTSHSRS